MPTIAILPGDGIGPEVTDQAVRVIEKLNELFDVQFTTQTQPVGGATAVGENWSPVATWKSAARSPQRTRPVQQPASCDAVPRTGRCFHTQTGRCLRFGHHDCAWADRRHLFWWPTSDRRRCRQSQRLQHDGLHGTRDRTNREVRVRNGHATR